MYTHATKPGWHSGWLGVAVLIALLGLAAPLAAVAGDVKVHGGSSCAPWQSLMPGEQINYSLGEGAFNAEFPGADIACPIVRDNHSTTTGMRVVAWVNDFGGEGEDDRVTCSVGIRKNTSYDRLDFETRATPVGATGKLKLDWGSSLGTSAAEAVYFMECRIPTYSALLSYRVDEL